MINQINRKLMVAPFGNFYCITYPHKTTLSEATVKVNGMGRTKWTYHKACNFASIYFIFLTFCFSLRTCYRNTQMSIFILFVSNVVSFGGTFSLRVSLKLILLQLLKTISIQMCHVL